MPSLCATKVTNLDAVSVSGALLLTAQWPAAVKSIRVGFLDGDPDTHRFVAEIASEWNLYSGIPFEFPGIEYIEAAYASHRTHIPLVMRGSGYHSVVTVPEDCDVRVSFNLSGIWSSMGIRSLHHNGASMSLSGIHAGMEVPEAKRVILHEFGHAFGLVHEHQHPDSNIFWNKPAVYDWYVGHLGWTEAEVDVHIFRTLDRDTLRTGVYDAESIMHYGLLAKYTTDGFSIPWPHTLSDGDKLFIKEIYPKEST